MTKKSVPSFVGRLYTDEHVGPGGLAGTWVRRAEVDALLDEIEKLQKDLRRANAALVRHGVEEMIPGNSPINAPEPLPIASFLGAVNVKDFGAVGDGVTDDSAAFQRAVNFALGIGSEPDKPLEPRFECHVCGRKYLTAEVRDHHQESCKDAAESWRALKSAGEWVCPNALKGHAGDPCPRCGSGPCPLLEAKRAELKSPAEPLPCPSVHDHLWRPAQHGEYCIRCNATKSGEQQPDKWAALRGDQWTPAEMERLKQRNRAPAEHEWDAYGKCKWCPAERTNSVETFPKEGS